MRNKANFGELQVGSVESQADKGRRRVLRVFALREETPCGVTTNTPVPRQTKPISIGWNWWQVLGGWKAIIPEMGGLGHLNKQSQFACNRWLRHRLGRTGWVRRDATSGTERAKQDAYVKSPRVQVRPAFLGQYQGSVRLIPTFVGRVKQSQFPASAGREPGDLAHKQSQFPADGIGGSACRIAVYIKEMGGWGI